MTNPATMPTDLTIKIGIAWGFLAYAEMLTRGVSQDLEFGASGEHPGNPDQPERPDFRHTPEFNNWTNAVESLNRQIKEVAGERADLDYPIFDFIGPTDYPQPEHPVEETPLVDLYRLDLERAEFLIAQAMKIFDRITGTRRQPDRTEPPTRRNQFQRSRTVLKREKNERCPIHGNTGSRR